MGITHVIRAEEWLSSLPKHVELYRGFGWEQPVFCHLPLLRNADRSKISKRKNPVSLNFYRRAGFLPEAMLNYLALMGWAMPDEREEFTARGVRRGVHPRAHLAGRARLRRREAEVAEREVPPAPLAEGAPRAAAGAAALGGPPPRGAAPRAGADRHARGLLRVRVLLLRGRGPLRRGGARKAMVAEGAHTGRDREGAAGAARGGGRPDPRVGAGDGRGGDPRLRREGGLGPERAVHGRARGHDRAGRLAAPLRDPRRARQGDLPPPPAPRRRRAEDWSRAK